MRPDRPDLVQLVSDIPSVEHAFRTGSAVAFLWKAPAEEIARAFRAVERYLSTLPIETSFPGADGLRADRQSLWIASTGLGKRLHYEIGEIANLDGDRAGGLRGLQLLKFQPEVAGALSVLKGEIDAGLQVTVQGLRWHEELPSSCIAGVTVRYRVVRYAPSQRGVAGIGLHPDGNVISALITDRPGLIVLGGPGWIARPDPVTGPLVMPGSILTRWSDGALQPTVHAVEIHRGDPVKCTVVGFLNFADGCDVPRSRRLTSRIDQFTNKVSEFKNDDMCPDDDLATFYRDRGFVVQEGDQARFLTLAELMAG